MAALFRKFWDICLLSAGPQDIPYSKALLKSLLLVYFLIESISWLASEDFERAVLATGLDTLILFLFIYLTLKAFNKTSRFVQVSSSFLAVGSLFQLLELPLMYMLEHARQNESAGADVGLVLIGLYSWSLAVFAHIFRQALEVRMLSAFVLTLCYVLITITAIQLAFPDIGQ